VEQGESPFSRPLIESFHPVSEGTMVEPNKASYKVLQFAKPQPSAEGELEKWFRGVMKSNHDLMSALERLRDSYKLLLTQKTGTEDDQGVLLAVEITLKNARNARAL
jgi:hypothetical protein